LVSAPAAGTPLGFVALAAGSKVLDTRLPMGVPIHFAGISSIDNGWRLSYHFLKRCEQARQPGEEKE